VNRSYRGLPKNGKPRHLPMHPDLVRVLRAWQERCPRVDGLVFPVEAEARRFRMGSKEDMLALPSILVAAECQAPAKPWHSLRHTFAAHSAMSGIPIYTLQKLMGHATIAMTQRYAHLAPDYLAAEVARLDFSGAPPSRRLRVA
jgi:integrase